MKIVKLGKKWVIRGEGEGWIFKKTFPRKWKAEVALEVFKEGGRFSDYCKRAKEKAPPKREPWRVLKKLEKALEEIKRLNPTCEEIMEYAEGAIEGVVTSARGEEYFGPSLHDTWGIKKGGRVHIDIGCGGYHLMLDKIYVEDFIQFIRNKRGMTNRDNSCSR